MKRFLLLLLLAPLLLAAQSRQQRKALEAQRKEEEQIVNNLKAHAEAVAGKSSNAAIEYIVRQFLSLGLQPKGTSGFVAPYKLPGQTTVTNASYLKIDGMTLQLHKEYFPLAWSGEKEVRGTPAIALREKGVPWFYDLKTFLGEKKAHGSAEEAVRREAIRAASKGATALIVYNSSNVGDSISFNKNDSSSHLSIPVVYLVKDVCRRYLSDASKMLDIELNVSLSRATPSGENLIAYEDNKRPAMGVVAASASLSRIGSAEALNIALLIEAAKLLAASKVKKASHVFMLLDEAEASGVAADFMMEHFLSPYAVNYIVYLDKQNAAENSKAIIHGTSTCAEWGRLIAGIPNRPDVDIDSVATFQGTEAVFCQRLIPFLSFKTEAMTESNNDGRKTTVFEAGMHTLKFLQKLIETTDEAGRLTFAKPVAAREIE